MISSKNHNNRFINNRVYASNQLIDQYNVILHHIKGEENPADLLTKNFAHNYAEEKLWVQGPKCLKIPDHWIPFKETLNGEMNVLYCAQIFIK